MCTQTVAGGCNIIPVDSTFNSVKFLIMNNLNLRHLWINISSIDKHYLYYLF